MLGIADRDWIISLLRALLDGDTAAALDVVANVHGYGYDMRSYLPAKYLQHYVTSS